MKWELERYKRQLGLVYQRRIMDLNVLLLGDGPSLPYVAINLASLGVGAGRGCIFLPTQANPVTSKHLEGQFFFELEDERLGISEAIVKRIHQLNPSVNVQVINDVDEYPYDAVLVAPGSELPSLPPNKLIIWAGTTSYGFYIGAQRPKATSNFSTNILTPSLASACAAIATQELLRVTKSVRVSGIQRSWITLNYSFHGPSDDLGTGKKFFVSGFRINPFKDVVSGPEPVYRVPIDFNSDYAKILLESVDIIEDTPLTFSRPIKCLYYSPFLHNRLQNGEIVEHPVELPSVIANKKLILGGVGGVGSWVAALLAVSKYEGELIIFDSDTQIEEHNLNRQILYDDKSIGLPKVEVAVRALHSLNSSLTARGFLEEVQAMTTVTRSSLMTDAHLVVTTFDNFKARYVLAEWAALNNVPLVNGGAERFVGDVELIVPQKNGCLFCVWVQERGSDAAESMRTSEEHVSCEREDPDSPAIGSSIVTTIATVASLQSLLSIITLVQPESLYDHALGYFGKDNAMEKCRLNLHSANGKCPIHESGYCQHPQQFLQTIEETISGEEI